MSGKDVLYELDRYIQWMHARARPEDAAIIESIRTRVAALVDAASAANKLYGCVWDRTDGCLVVFPDNVARFDDAFERLNEALRELGR